jgi:uncharacterized protein (TIGR02147 family)
MTSDYRALLKEEFASRAAANPLYSLRAFARDLQISSGRLSDVLNGKSGLSVSTARKLALQLKFSPEETKLFLAYVERKHARLKLKKANAEAYLSEFEKRAKYNVLPLDHFKVVADWYYFALLEACSLSDKKNNFKWFAKRLKISPEEARVACERLIRLGLLENKNNELTPTEDFTATPSDIPSEAIQRHHLQILEKAKQALTHLPVDTRDFSTITVAIRSKDLPEAKEMIKEFRRRFNEKFRKAKTKDQVYCLGVQCFPLTSNLEELS